MVWCGCCWDIIFCLVMIVIIVWICVILVFFFGERFLGVCIMCWYCLIWVIIICCVVCVLDRCWMCVVLGSGGLLCVFV